NFQPAITPSQSISDAASVDNGKLLIAGFFTNVDGTAVQGLVKLRGDGSLDNSFIPNSVTGTVSRVAASDDGFSWAMAAERVLRLTADGSLAPDFVSHTNSGGESPVLGVQPDGKAIVGGYLSSYDGTPVRDLVRLNTNGSIDSGFVFNPVGKQVSSIDFQ